MNKEKKRYEVTIFGDQYVLVSDESSERVMDVAQRVDLLLRDIAEASKLSDSKKIAVLAALQTMDKVVALEAEAEEKRVRHKDLMSRIDQECSPTP